MNSVLFGQFTQFVPPKLEPILAPKSLVFWVVNVCTAGIFGSAETLGKRHQIKELKSTQEDLLSQVADLTYGWSELEKELTELLDRLKTLNENDPKLRKEGNELKNRLSELSANIDDLGEQSLKKKNGNSVTISEVALGTIAFVGQLISNILSIGLWGVYQNYKLKNRLTLLNAENDFIQKQFETQKQEKLETFKKFIDSFNDFIETKEENNTLLEQFDGIKNTDQGKAYLEAQQAKLNLANLQQQHKDLQNQMTALKIEKTVLEKDKQAVESDAAKKAKEVQDLRTRVTTLSDDEWKLKQERDRLKQDLVKKDADEKKRTADLHVQLNAANAKAAQVTVLEKQVAALQAAQKHASALTKLAGELGPIPPKYMPRPTDQEISGAMDIDNLDEDDYTPSQIAFMKDYNKRYGGKRTAVEVVQASFQNAYDQLIDIGNTVNGAIKLNRAGNTIASFGSCVVYRFMALDMISGGKVADNGCHGFQLKINDDVSMLPSQSEKIIQYKDNQMGGFDPIVSFHYKQRDDFTPDEEALRLRDGVNAPAAKWIFQQLTDQEKKHLLTHLMSPVIENTHPEYKAMMAFMSNKGDPRVKLVLTASELMQDIATAIRYKFEKNALSRCWGANANDWDIEPFVKAEDDIKGLDELADDGIAEVAKGAKVVDWAVDLDVLGDKRQYDATFRQKDFSNLVVASQKSYQTIYQYFNDVELLRKPADKLKEPYPNGTQFSKLEWKPINEQYHVAHQMIGADFEGKGGDRCLFSNLLAVLITNKSELTSNNVQKLKNAMANYLDKLVKAKNQWSIEEKKAVHARSKDAAQIEEMAKLASAFETAIFKTHGCNLTAYQGWLRGDMWGAKIDVGNLTPLEIQIAAYTIGVRIGLLSINMKGASEVDGSGRIVPSGEYYGPNTKEFLLMGCWDPMNGKGGSYYSLFPKLNTVDNDLLEAVPAAFEAALDLENYWMTIDINHIKE